MNPPADAEVFEGELATFWFDENGILCARAKRAERNLARQQENYALIRKIANNKRVCLLSDTSNASPQDKETREYAAAEMPNIFKAMAVISETVLGKFIANVFIGLKQQPIPIKMFNNEKEAKGWLNQYLSEQE